MKILFCENCGDLVVPSVEAYRPKWCRCGGSCCWWIEPNKGEFACWSQLGKESVSIIGINNSLFTTSFPLIESEGKKLEHGCINKITIKELIDSTPDSYIFKKVESLICRFRPGFSSDTFFASKPPARLNSNPSVN